MIETNSSKASPYPNHHLIQKILQNQISFSSFSSETKQTKKQSSIQQNKQQQQEQISQSINEVELQQKEKFSSTNIEQEVIQIEQNKNHSEQIKSLLAKIDLLSSQSQQYSKQTKILELSIIIESQKYSELQNKYEHLHFYLKRNAEEFKCVEQSKKDTFNTIYLHRFESELKQQLENQKEEFAKLLGAVKMSSEKKHFIKLQDENLKYKAQINGINEEYEEQNRIQKNKLEEINRNVQELQQQQHKLSKLTEKQSLIIQQLQSDKISLESNKKQLLLSEETSLQKQEREELTKENEQLQMMITTKQEEIEILKKENNGLNLQIVSLSKQTNINYQKYQEENSKTGTSFLTNYYLHNTKDSMSPYLINKTPQIRILKNQKSTSQLFHHLNENNMTAPLPNDIGNLTTPHKTRNNSSFFSNCIGRSGHLNNATPQKTSKRIQIFQCSVQFPPRQDHFSCKNSPFTPLQQTISS